MHDCFYGKINGQSAKKPCNSRLITVLGKRDGIASVPFQKMRSFGGRQFRRPGGTWIMGHMDMICMTMPE